MRDVIEGVVGLPGEQILAGALLRRLALGGKVDLRNVLVIFDADIEE